MLDNGSCCHHRHCRAAAPSKQSWRAHRPTGLGAQGRAPRPVCPRRPRAERQRSWRAAKRVGSHASPALARPEQMASRASQPQQQPGHSSLCHSNSHSNSHSSLSTATATSAVSQSSPQTQLRNPQPQIHSAARVAETATVGATAGATAGAAAQPRLSEKPKTAGRGATNTSPQPRCVLSDRRMAATAATAATATSTSATAEQLRRRGRAGGCVARVHRPRASQGFGVVLQRGASPRPAPSRGPRRSTAVTKLSWRAAKRIGGSRASLLQARRGDGE